MLTNPQALAFAVAGPVIKQQGQAPVYQTLTTSYDMNDVSGFRAANRQTAVAPSPLGEFPASYGPLASSSSAGEGKWVSSNSGGNSKWAGGSLASPWDGNFIFTEGSGVNNDGKSLAYRFVLKLPGQWRRANGVSMSVEVQADVPPELNPQVSMWYRAPGDAEGQLTKGAGSLTGASSTRRTAQFTAPASTDLAILYLVVQSDATNSYPNKAFFDVGFDNMTVTETFV